MSKPHISIAQNTNLPYTGNLTVNVTSTQGLIPIQNATITISLTGDPESVVE